jgi:hypothetical protein
MDDLRKYLDEEARRVETGPDPLEAVKRRAGRRRVTRQVGTGALALAVAGAGLGVAFSAFRGGSGVRPLVGPTNSLSPWPPSNILVVGPGNLGDAASALASRLDKAGHDVNIVFCADCPVHPSTTIQYRPDAEAEAESIRSEFLPGADLERVTWPANRGDIHLNLGADYTEPANGTVRVSVLDAGGGRAATDTAAGQLRGAGYDVVEVGDAPSVFDKTVVACAPQHDEAGLRILKQFFPTAEFRGQIPSLDHDVTVYVASDWSGG